MLRDNKVPSSDVSGTLRVPLLFGGTRSVPDTIPVTYCRAAAQGPAPLQGGAAGRTIVCATFKVRVAWPEK